LHKQGERASRKSYWLGTIPTPQDSEQLDLNMDEAKAKKNARDTNGLVYEEMFLSIDTSTSSSKVAFQRGLCIGLEVTSDKICSKACLHQDGAQARVPEKPPEVYRCQSCQMKHRVGRDLNASQGHEFGHCKQ